MAFKTPTLAAPPGGLTSLPPGMAGTGIGYWNTGYWNNGYWPTGRLGLAGPLPFTASAGVTDIQTIIIIGSWPPTDIGEATAAEDPTDAI